MCHPCLPHWGKDGGSTLVLVSPGLWLELHKCFSAFCFPAWGGTGWLEQAAVGCFYSSAKLALITSQHIRRWLTSFPWGQNFLSRVLWYILKWFIFSYPCWKPLRGFFSDIYCGNLVELLKVSLTVLCLPVPMTGSPGFFKLSQLFTPVIHELYNSGFLTQH